MRPAAIALLAIAAVAAQESAPTAKSMYAAAVTDYNAGRMPDARKKLAELFDQHPKYFRGYDLFWSVIGRTENEDARKAAVRRTLPLFENASGDERDEDFYVNFIKACEIIGDPARAEALKKEQVARVPKGLAAQQAILSKARNEIDPVKAVDLYDSYL